MNKAQAKEISADIKDALQKVAEKHGMTVDYRGVTYSPEGSIKPRVELKGSDTDRLEFGMHATSYGLAPGDFGEDFVSNGRLFRIAGVSPRSPKRPILCTEVETGRTFKFAANAVRVGLGK